jgi:hypothetical protein
VSYRASLTVVDWVCLREKSLLFYPNDPGGLPIETGAPPRGFRQVWQGAAAVETGEEKPREDGTAGDERTRLPTAVRLVGAVLSR